MLLRNAIDMLRVGMADYQIGDHARLLSAVRNLHGGVILLYKEALRRLSPAGSEDVLVKERILPKRLPDGTIVFQGTGKRTANVDTIRERFESLGLGVDWKRLETVTKARNNAEHYFSDLKKSALGGVVSNCMVLVRDFMVNELKLDPKSNLGDEAWNAMLRVAEIVEAERLECRRLLGLVAWESPTLQAAVFDLACRSCASPLLAPVDSSDRTEVTSVVLLCRSCGEEEDATSFVARSLKEHLAWDQFEASRESLDSPCVTCPTCNSDAFVVAEWRCVYCGETPERRCSRCETEIPPEELNGSGLCGYCEHMSTKDD